MFTTQSSIRAFQNWSDRLLEMKTRKVMARSVPRWGKLGEPSQRAYWDSWEYRSVLLIGFFHILPLPGVPLHLVWTGSVRDVSTLFAQNRKLLLKKFFNRAIKLGELYGSVEKHSKAHIQNFDEKSRATARYLFNPSVGTVCALKF